MGWLAWGNFPGCRLIHRLGGATAGMACPSWYFILLGFGPAVQAMFGYLLGSWAAPQGLGRPGGPTLSRLPHSDRVDHLGRWPMCQTVRPSEAGQPGRLRGNLPELPAPGDRVGREAARVARRGVGVAKRQCPPVGSALPELPRFPSNLVPC